MMQWFPGHMAKALRQIQDQQKIVDLFIIVLDGRAPLSCYNPEFDKVLGNKMRLFVISKIDMADLKKINHFEKKMIFKYPTISLNLKKNNSYEKLNAKIKRIFQEKKLRDQNKGIIKKSLKIAIMGIPNVGKSTLINLLSKKYKAAVANIPGVTRAAQWINSGQMLLLDTPGILMPKIDDELVAIKLATIGVIKDAILDKTTLFYQSYRLVSQMYPHKILQLNLLPSEDEIAIDQELQKHCKNKHFFQKNQELDLNRGREFILQYFKNLSGITYD